MRTGSRLQGYGRQTDNGCDCLLQLPHQLQGALNLFFRLVWVQLAEAGQGRHSVVDLGVIFHGAGSKWVHAEIDRIIPGGKASEMTNDFNLTHFGHLAEIFSFSGSQQLRGVDVRHIEGWQPPCRLSGR